MQVLAHHIYEYKKGLRHLVLHTLNSSSREDAEKRLKQQQINYLIREVSDSKINIFFGKPECVNVVREMGHKGFHLFTPEEDFILGIMLGYDRLEQCRRYLTIKSKAIRILDC